MVNQHACSYSLENPVLRNSTLSQNKLKSISLGKLIEDVGGEASINDLTFLSGGSALTDYFFLKLIMQRCNLKTYLEIGTWTGESIAAVAEVAEQCYSISLPDEDYNLSNVFEKYCGKDNFSRYFSNNKSNIKHFYESSLNFDFEKLPEHIDLIFIDGDHSYQAIKSDTQNIFKKFGYDNTIVVWHDFKTVRNELVDTTYEAVRDSIPEQFHNNLFTVHTNYCGVYVPEKYQNYFGFDEKSDTVYSYEVTLESRRNELK